MKKKKHMAYFPLILVAVGGVVLTAGDLVMKKWAAGSGLSFYVVGLLIYLVGLMFLAQSYKYRNIGVVSLVIVIFNVTTLSLVSWFYYKERISLMQLSGLLLGFVAVVMLELGRES